MSDLENQTAQDDRRDYEQAQAGRDANSGRASGLGAPRVPANGGHV